MRFSHFLKYNAVPEWQNHYVDYNELKNLIYTLQTDELGLNNNDDQDDLNSNIDGNSNDLNLAARLKRKLFSSKNNTPISSPSSIVGSPRDPFKDDLEGNYNNTNSGKKDDMIQEETIELQDFKSLPPPATNSNNQRNENSRLKKLSPFKKVVNNKFFDSSRRSSDSSDDKTLFNTYDSFYNNLTQEKLKIDDFYKRTEAKFFQRFDTLITDLEKEKISSSTRSSTMDLQELNSNSNSTNNKTQQFGNEEEDDEEEEDFEDEFGNTQEETALLHYREFDIKSQKKSILKKNIVNLYIDLSQLKAFIELNKMGFSKITKKADKVLKFNMRAELIQTGDFYSDTYIFQKNTFTTLSNKINQLIEFYSKITSLNNDQLAKQELKSFLHDHIVWERSNTWKDMLGLLSQENTLNQDLDAQDPNAAVLGKLQLEYFKIPFPTSMYNERFFPFENLFIPKLFFTWKAAKIAFVILFTGILLGVKTFNDHVEGRCMALVECVALLWAFEALPLHITAMLVPLLVVLFRVLKDTDGSVLGAAAASSKILASMWTSTIIILLAGFTLGEVLAQYNIARVIASWLLAAAGTKPRNVLLMAMGVVFFLSMWISNVAAPVLTYSLLSPLLDPLDADVPFAKALVLGVAIGANIGGMSSPISSPQNIISMEYLKPYGINWGQFFAVALPAGILATLLCWGILCATFKINLTKLEKFKPIRTKFTLKQWFICAVTVATIILWCVEAQIESAFGSSGQIAIIPIVVFFGSGLLSTKDFNTFPWSIVILAMGGTALGSAVSSSGLLATIAKALQRRIEHDTTMAVLCIFGALMLVVGTFVSHTVSAIIIIPLVKEVGDELGDPKAAPILVFGCALLASAGMGLASSGFPNVTAISMNDKNNKPYLNMATFISRGVPCSIVVFLCVITLGYGIMSSILHGVASA
ncbi:similar to Saccharomyces cerevisiae YCR037C PHO87 Low-affinity inorganic phosphate (Pi) transporter, involved in activation of PHO pathway [Maudiozyma saulgeensis]|uniref:Similar to Saccharomyces cerevisiae YCR037C PHO87 Low-affinity inorganic phosphate (Pi) transporter, involved in activation of PHO pathway n=1 Tax=Maudiozyma saulgeensis TaxID=1789683 RepID=A0A1X7R181_9SACH|nr:similar to Saccharomyces cerevisiae YCR037C PHO87 Low-affinity inorganic phosphate (Pi) transporter, involved in activation of PHO pathway [Kazachstania saulgeensis]